MSKKLFLITLVISLFQHLNAQTDEEWIANGTGNTYSKLQSLTGARPQVPCGHGSFTDTGHIDEIMDTELNKHVFRFAMHASEDGNYNQCNPAEIKERQRNELAYNTAKPTQKVKYTWYMKLPSDFKTTTNFNYNFCHLHQIKLRDGSYSSQPMFTLSAWRDQLELITSTTDYNGDRVLASESLANFLGKWVAITEIINYGDTTASGAYGIQIKELFGTQETLFTFVDNNIQTWKGFATNLQVKWGLYRMRTSIGGGTVFTDLKDEQVLYDNFKVTYLNDGESIQFDAPKVLLTHNTTNGIITVNPEVANNEYDEGAEITLSAVPNEGYEFTRWEQDASGSLNPMMVTMNTAKNITAVFTEIPQETESYQLTILSLNGSVTTNPSSDNDMYQAGTEISLTAVPNEGYEFTGWEQDANGSSNPVMVTMNTAKNITAVFTEIPQETESFLLTLESVNGVITANPSTENGMYEEGTEVLLTAVANEGYEFIRWEQDASGSSNTVAITMTEAQNISVVFSLLLFESDIDNQITISPNPVKTVLTITNTSDLEIIGSTIYNSDGRQMLRSLANELSVSNYASGIYLLKIDIKNQKPVYKKIIKQ